MESRNSFLKKIGLGVLSLGLATTVFGKKSKNAVPDIKLMDVEEANEIIKILPDNTELTIKPERAPLNTKSELDEN